VSYDGARITTKKLADCGTHHALIKSFSSLTGAATGAASLVLFPIPVPTAVIIVKQQNCCDCLSEMCLSFTNKQLQKSAIISKVVWENKVANYSASPKQLLVCVTNKKLIRIVQKHILSKSDRVTGQIDYTFLAIHHHATHAEMCIVVMIWRSKWSPSLPGFTERIDALSWSALRNR